MNPKPEFASGQSSAKETDVGEETNYSEKILENLVTITWNNCMNAESDLTPVRDVTESTTVLPLNVFTSSCYHSTGNSHKFDSYFHE